LSTGSTNWRAALRPRQERLLVRLAAFRRGNARARAYQNATGLQVTSAVLAGMVYALENPELGIVETDEMDFRRCLEVQMPYLGPVKGYFTDWTPLSNRLSLFPEKIDTADPWQFRNVLVH
jgi:homospermidine synthase